LLCTGRDHQRPGRVTDLTPLADLRAGLRVLELHFNTRLKDLRPLSGMQLRSLNLGFTAVEDLRPLADVPLKSLRIGWTPARDLAPLARTPVEFLDCRGNSQRDLGSLRGAARLTTLLTEAVPARHAAALRAIPTL